MRSVGSGWRRIECSERSGVRTDSTGGAGMRRIAVRLTMWRGPSSPAVSATSHHGSYVDHDRPRQVVVPAAALTAAVLDGRPGEGGDADPEGGQAGGAQHERAQQGRPHPDRGAVAVVDHAQAGHGLAGRAAADAQHDREDQPEEHHRARDHADHGPHVVGDEDRGEHTPRAASTLQARSRSTANAVEPSLELGDRVGHGGAGAGSRRRGCSGVRDLDGDAVAEVEDGTRDQADGDARRQVLGRRGRAGPGRCRWSSPGRWRSRSRGRRRRRVGSRGGSRRSPGGGSAPSPRGAGRARRSAGPRGHARRGRCGRRRRRRRSRRPAARPGCETTSGASSWPGIRRPVEVGLRDADHGLAVAVGPVVRDDRRLAGRGGVARGLRRSSAAPRRPARAPASGSGVGLGGSGSGGLGYDGQVPAPRPARREARAPRELPVGATTPAADGVPNSTTETRARPVVTRRARRRRHRSSVDTGCW